MGVRIASLLALVAACGGGAPAPETRAAAVSNEAADPERELEPPPDQEPEDPSALMDEANRAYDRMDYQRAIELAEQVVSQDPDSVRARRVGTSAACAMGLADRARSFAAGLPERDYRQMETRCLRFGIQL